MLTLLVLLLLLLLLVVAAVVKLMRLPSLVLVVLLLSLLLPQVMVLPLLPPLVLVVLLLFLLLLLHRLLCALGRVHAPLPHDTWQCRLLPGGSKAMAAAAWLHAALGTGQQSGRGQQHGRCARGCVRLHGSAAARLHACWCCLPKL